jgi:hypothetical protein
MKICKQCKSKINSSNIYHNFIYCSRSCATTAQRGGLTKAMIEEEIVAYVINKGKYSTLSEILKGIGRSNKTVSKFGISIKKIQESLGIVKSKSHFEASIYSVLTKEFDNVICEVTSEDLVSPKGYPLRIDFYIPELNLYIEADGNQHTDPNNPWYNEYFVECDQLKTAYCNKIGTLIRIPYTKNATTEYVLKHLRACRAQLVTVIVNA